MMMKNTVFQNLNEDFICETLSRLPTITLLRFKSVSKTWYSLISNPDFRIRHTARCSVHHDPSPPPPGIILGRHLHPGNSLIVILPAIPPNYQQQQNHAFELLAQTLIHYCPPLHDLPKENFILTDSCNGLLLYNNINNDSFYVCNPITKDYIELPPLKITHIDKQQYHDKKIAQIVFNPLSSQTYKVFTWVSSSNYDRNLYVYSSETRSWRHSISVPVTEFPLFFSYDLKAVLWNGVLHWTTLFGGTDEVSLCYDIEKENVWIMKFPKMTTGFTHQNLLYFGECGGRLLLIVHHYRSADVNWFPSSFNVMERQENVEDGWRVRYCVDFDEVGNDYYSEIIRKNPFMDVNIFDIYRVTTEKGNEEEMLLMRFRDQIISFNLTKNMFEEKELRNGFDAIGMLLYTEVLRYSISLYPP